MRATAATVSGLFVITELTALRRLGRNLNGEIFIR